MAWETFPYSYTSPYIHSWIFETLQVIIFWVTHKKLNVNSSTWITHLTHPYMTHPTPPLHDPPHPPAWPTPPHLYMTHPTHPPLHDPPTPLYHTPPLHDPPTPPYPWYIFGHKGAFFHGLLHYVFTPPHPYMTHPTPPLHDPPTPPHPFMTTPPHPTPPPVHFWAQRSLFSWAASLCLPLGRQ